MELWIGVEDRGGRRDIRLEGRLAGEAIGELGRVIRSLEPPVRLDLNELLSADAEGLETLRSLRSSGAELFGARPLIEHLLEEDPNGDRSAVDPVHR